MNSKMRILLVEIISALFVLLFVYAALSKYFDFERFRAQIGKSPLLSGYTNVVAVFVPASEILITILLVIKRTQYYALYATFSLMVMFSAYIVAILKFSSYIPCSCGGVLQNMSWGQHLLFNLVYVVLGIVAILIYPTKNQNLICAK
jgi:uncharacterized membrane protein YphA (DoxX/SURF4 family)